MRTQKVLEKEVVDLREEVEAKKQHEQGLRRELQVGIYPFQIVSFYELCML